MCTCATGVTHRLLSREHDMDRGNRGILTRSEGRDFKIEWQVSFHVDISS